MPGTGLNAIDLLQLGEDQQEAESGFGHLAHFVAKIDNQLLSTTQAFKVTSNYLK